MADGEKCPHCGQNHEDPEDFDQNDVVATIDPFGRIVIGTFKDVLAYIEQFTAAQQESADKAEVAHLN